MFFNHMRDIEEDKVDSPIVFISYSHDDLKHMDWVLKLASNVRSDGVDVILDQWDLRLGKDIRLFIDKWVSASKLVLCICSEQYVQKVNSATSGAGYEGMKISTPLLSNANLEHVIPIIRNNYSQHKVPSFLESKIYIDFSNDNEYKFSYNKLLERIYDEDLKKKPPLGKNPFSTELSKHIDKKTKIESNQYHTNTMNGKVIFRYDNNDGIYIIGNGEYSFETRWTRADNNSIHVYGQIGYIPGVTVIPDLRELYNYDYSSYSRTIKTGEIIVYKNDNHHFAAVKLIQVKSSNHGNPYDEMTFEYHIYYPE